MYYARFIFFALLPFLTGCLMVESEVESFSGFSEDPKAAKFAVVPMRQEDGSSLEWTTNAGKLLGLLNSKGYQVTNNIDDADILVVFGFLADEGQTQRYSYSLPTYGVTGYSGSSTSGNIYGNSFSATTTYTPRYGVTGYTQHQGARVVYTRGVGIDMYNKVTKQRVFEGTAFSSGRCSSFSGVATEMISALLTDFPKGKVGTVSVESQGNC